MWCAHRTAHKPRSTRFAVLNSSASSNPSRCIAITSLSPCMRVGVPGVRMASCGASPNATSGSGAASIGTTRAFFESRSTIWKSCRRNTPRDTKSSDFGFVHKNKWIHQNHCFPNPHNDLHVALKPTPNNKKRENRYVGIHITISFFVPNLRICWARTTNHYVGLNSLKN